jgi:parallel beta-helix repeat protein
MLGCIGLFRAKPQIVRKAGIPKAERIVLSGSVASHRVIDCNGGWFNEGKATELIIQSRQITNGWDRPEGITIRNCRIRGAIRIMGMGRNGQGPLVRESSRERGHTERAQAAAPRQILISNVEIEADGGIPLYLAPGVTGVTVANSKFTGCSRSTAIYLDAESANNIICSNIFALRALREIIAVDGSASNRIEGNRFDQIPAGGIYLYRNCGEGGTIRHQTPHDNTIIGNCFNAKSLGFRSYGIWVGSRNGHRLYSEDDAGYDFGSSVDNRDFADDNTVVSNVFLWPSSHDIRDNGHNNRIDRPR